MRAQAVPPPKTSRRWIVNATLVSLAFAVLLLCAIFLITVIPNAMYSAETGWQDYTPEQLRRMKSWFLFLLVGGVGLIFLFFYLRRSKDA